MNIKVQACGFVLLVILYLLYHQQHTLQTYSRRAFLRFYAVTVLCILMDILSIVAIESASHLPALFVTFVCKTYLITLVLTAYAVFYFTCSISAAAGVAAGICCSPTKPSGKQSTLSCLSPPSSVFPSIFFRFPYTVILLHTSYTLMVLLHS